MPCQLWHNANPAQARASNPPGGATRNPVAKCSAAHVPGSLSTRDTFSVHRPLAFPVTYILLAARLTCVRRGSDVTRERAEAGLRRRWEAFRQHGSPADEAPAQEDREAEPQVAAEEPQAAG